MKGTASKRPGPLRPGLGCRYFESTVKFFVYEITITVKYNCKLKMCLTARFESAYRRAQLFRKNFHTTHPCIYDACKFIIHEGLHYALDACGTLIGDPPLFEEIEAIYFGLKMAAKISFKLYHYLKSKSHVHKQQIEHMAHHEQGRQEQQAVGRVVGRAASRAVRRARSGQSDEDDLDSENEGSVDDDKDVADDNNEGSDSGGDDDDY